MSFVYAEQHMENTPDGELEVTNIYSDTKIQDCKQVDWGKRTAEMVNRYGMLKTIIPAEDFCISFAGNNISYMSKLMEQLYQCGTFEFEELIEKAWAIHESAEKDAIEFIICYIESGRVHIVVIKDREIRMNCKNAWIGSPMAFEKLQEIRLTEYKKDSSKDGTFDSTWFYRAVDECGDSGVGGFNIRVQCDGRTFVYPYTLTSNVPNQIVKPNENIKLLATASEGGFTVEYIQDGSDLRVVLEQADLTIFYNSRYVYDNFDLHNGKTRHFKLPLLVRTSTGKVIYEKIC